MIGLEVMVDDEWVPVGAAASLEPQPQPQPQPDPSTEPRRFGGFTAELSIVDEGGRLWDQLARLLPPWHPMPRYVSPGSALLAAVQRAGLPASMPRCAPVAFDLNAVLATFGQDAPT